MNAVSEAIMPVDAEPAAPPPAPRLSLAPVPYFWSAERLRRFYRDAAGWPVDIVYLGEVVCSKRRALRYGDWLDIAAELEAAGKEVVLSGLTLIESAAELGALERWCANGRFAVEANDMAAVHFLSAAGVSFVGGPTLNIYHPRTLAVLAAQGMRRFVLPYELSGPAAAALTATAPAGVECEVYAWGRLPLAWSARCYSARAARKCKDACDLVCAADPDGKVMYSQDGVPFLVINGIQTQSALTHNLAPAIGELCRAGVGVLRLSPQSAAMAEIVAGFAAGVHGDGAAGLLRNLAAHAPLGTCDGYWRGLAGHETAAAGDDARPAIGDSHRDRPSGTVTEAAQPGPGNPGPQSGTVMRCRHEMP